MPITQPPKKPACDSTFVYTVKSGDNFDGIAYRNKSNPEQLQKDNPDVKPSSIYIGQELNVSTYKTSTWNAYQNKVNEYNQYLLNEHENSKKSNANNQQATEQKKHTCPKFLDDPFGWVEHRLLCH